MKFKNEQYLNKLNRVFIIMWKRFVKYFESYPKRRVVAQKMLEYGLKVHNNKIYCGNIELSDSKIARALHVDRRAIATTVDIITKEPELLKIFSKMSPTCLLKDVAPSMNWGVIEIIPEDPSIPGIVADVASIIAQNNISIRQAIGDDFELTEDPRLYIVTEKPIPGRLIPQIKNAHGVKAVLIC
jgi:hypothetical protein